MSITSFYFFVYVAVLLVLYYIVPRKTQWIILLLGSIGFYASQEIKSLIFLFTTITLNYLMGLWIEKQTDRQAVELQAEGLDKEAKKQIKETYKKRKKRISRTSIVLMLLLLFVMKYTIFTFDNINAVASWFGGDAICPKLNILLPLGISYYTFQSIAYIVDVSKDKIPAERNYFRYALFVCWFPQITQGPIGRFNLLAPQLFAERKFEFHNIKFGFELFLYGMFKKLVLADRIGSVIGDVLGNYTQHGRWELLLCLALYSIQIYADFSGCMDIIGGISEMFGIELSKNFLRPNFSKDMPEFWRRWHATLGSFFKDYVFYPISVSNTCQTLNRKCRKVFGPEAGRIISSLLPIYAVWFCTGFWHGASWKFIVWGLFHGTLVALNLVLMPLSEKLCEKLHIDRTRFSFRLAQMVKTYLLCMTGRVFFYMPNLSSAMGFFKQVITHNDPWVLINGGILTELGSDGYELTIIALSILVLWAVGMMQERFKVRERLEQQGLVFRWIVVFSAIFIIIIYGQYGQGFDAAAFLYKDF